MSELSNNVAMAFKEYNRLEQQNERLSKALERALQLLGGWREAVVELEGLCSEPVRLCNMLAAADQMDDWKKQAREALAA